MFGSLLCFCFVAAESAALYNTSSMLYMCLIGLHNLCMYTAIAAYLTSLFVPLAPIDRRIGVLIRYLWTLIVAPIIMTGVRLYRAYLEDLTISLPSSDPMRDRVVRSLSFTVIAFDLAFLLAALVAIAYLAVARREFTRCLRLTVGPSVLASRRGLDDVAGSGDIGMTDVSLDPRVAVPDLRQLRLAYGIPAAAAAAAAVASAGVRALRSTRSFLGWLLLLFTAAVVASVGVSVPGWVSGGDPATVFVLSSASTWVGYCCVLLGCCGGFVVEASQCYREFRALALGGGGGGGAETRSARLSSTSSDVVIMKALA
ncbi:hypothetical protein HK405_013373 [Cladochytrium tenue]|nr:hypothetical protein HK405_013373 [Cladochytrium tenue]